mgnify:CR=1 FL=1
MNGSRFFNSVHRNVTNDSDVSNDEMFVHSSTDSPSTVSPENMYRTYRPDGDLLTMMRSILDDLGFSVCWQDIDRDIQNVLRSMTESHHEVLRVEDIKIEILHSIFYRNKGAYIVGRLCQGQQQWPLALPILRSGDGKIYVAGENGFVVVLNNDGEELKILAKNDMDDAIIGTPAISDGQLIVRTRSRLYCIAGE